MASRGRWLTHAGAVGRGGRGVLLVGRGGSGKSTLALSCALAGMEIVADDYVLLETGQPPIAHAMQSTAKLTEDSAARLGLSSDAIDATGFEPTLEGPAKALVEIPALAPGAMARQLEITAVLAPVLPALTSPLLAHTAKKDEVSPFPQSISAAQGLRAVAPSTIVQSGFQGASSLAALADLVRQVPSYELELSPDPASNAAAVGRLVDELD
jgi:energy-coupling factor transporter ATP-binding protein EcfA2